MQVVSWQRSFFSGVSKFCNSEIFVLDLYSLVCQNGPDSASLRRSLRQMTGRRKKLIACVDRKCIELSYPKINNILQELRPPALKELVFGTLFARPLSSGETDQASQLGCFSTDRDKIWCVKAPLVDIDSYQVSSRSVEKCSSYTTFCFYYKIATLLHFIVRGKSLF